MESNCKSDRLSHEIFSILESNFLFGVDHPTAAMSPAPHGKVRVLCIDGGVGDGGIFAGAALALLESHIREITGEPAARIADYFDLAAGSGAGGVLAALLFSTNISASDAAELVSKHRKLFSGNRQGGRRLFGGIFRKRKEAVWDIFEESTLKDAVKPLLLPCYDMTTSAPFVFSRADAVESDGFDFPLREACAATCFSGADARSMDGKTRIRSAAGMVAMPNPAAVAITHVLHNKQEFPFAKGIDDIIVVSIGSSGWSVATGNHLRIATAAQADMVDQAIAMAFGERRAANYVRIQGNVAGPAKAAAEMALNEWGVDSVLFRGRKMMNQTNAERLEAAAHQLIAEEQRRERSTLPTVLIKSAGTPRSTLSSSSSRSASATMSTTDSSVSPRCN